MNTTFSFDAGSESQRKIYNPASKSWKKNKNAVKNYSINEATNYNGNILSQLKRTNDEFIQYIEGNNTINSSYDENEELDKWDSLNQGPNSAIWSIERKKNIDITEIEPHYILNTYNSNDENMPIMYKQNQTNINAKKGQYRYLPRQAPSYRIF